MQTIYRIFKLFWNSLDINDIYVYHPPAGETGRAGPTGPNKDGLCHHRSHRRRYQGQCGVPDGGPLGLPPSGADGGSEAKRPAGRGGLGGDHCEGPTPRRALTVTCDKDGGLDDGAAKHGKRERTGYAVMARYPLLVIWIRSPRPPPLL